MVCRKVQEKAESSLFSQNRSKPLKLFCKRLAVENFAKFARKQENSDRVLSKENCKLSLKPGAIR